MDGRLKKSRKNLLHGIIYQVSYVVFNFLTRMVMVRSLGMVSVSLNGLFSEILSVLSLAELGIGSAIIYSLYVPLALDDHKKVTQIMNLFKTAYRIISGVVAAIGIVLVPFIPHLITNTVIDGHYLIAVYLLFLAQTSISYLFSYKAALLNADQKSYVVSICTMAVRFVFFFLNIACLMIFRNFILYLVLDIVQTLMTNLFISRKVDQMYPYVKDKDRLSPDEQKDIFSNVRHLFIGSLSGKITNSTDNILISLLVGTNHIGPYSQYSMIMNGITRMFSQASGAITGSVGNLLVTENHTKCRQTFENVTFIFFLAGSVCSCCFYTLVNPFLSAFIGNDYILPGTVVYILTLNLFFSVLKMPLWTFMSASGLFKKDKYISIIGSSLNLAISIVLGMTYGMAGIFLGTLISLLVQSTLKLALFYHGFLGTAEKNVLIRWMLYVLLCAGEFIGCRFLTGLIPFSHTIPGFVIGLGISATVPLLVDTAVFHRTDEFLYWYRMAAGKLESRFRPCLRNPPD